MALKAGDLIVLVTNVISTSKVLLRELFLMAFKHEELYTIYTALWTQKWRKSKYISVDWSKWQKLSNCIFVLLPIIWKMIHSISFQIKNIHHKTTHLCKHNKTCTVQLCNKVLVYYCHKFFGISSISFAKIIVFFSICF